MKPWAHLGAIVRDVQRSQLANTSPQEPAQLIARVRAPRERSAVREMIEAVVALCGDPCPANVERYLAASRAVEDVRGAA